MDERAGTPSPGGDHQPPEQPADQPVDGGLGPPDAAPLWQEIADVLLRAARERPQVRTALDWLSGELRRIARSSEPLPQEEEQEAQPGRSAVPRVMTTLRLGDQTLEVPVIAAGGEEPSVAPPPPPAARAAPPPSAAPDAPDLRLIIKRCRLKAECCRWAITRRRRIAEGATFDTDVRPNDERLIGRAKELPNCYVWALGAYNLPDDARLEEMAGAYENLAAAAEIAHEVYNDDEGERFLDDAYQLLAAAQSAVRVGLEDQSHRDPDQEDAFRWLKRRTFEDQVFVARHMKLSDPADPGNWDELQQRIEGFQSEFDQFRRSRRERAHLLNKARYHAGRLERKTSPDAAADWRTLVDTVDRLVAKGVQPSNTDLRDVVLPVFDEVPEEIETTEAFSLVMREVDRFVASQESAQEVRREPRARSPEVREVADLLRDRVVVLIGGERRPHAQRALEADFELAELHWISTRAHQSPSEFEPAIARPETALVLLAIRWVSHSFEAAKAMCDRHGKAYVRLPRGYNSNQVAVEVLKQASEQLRAMRGHA